MKQMSGCTCRVTVGCAVKAGNACPKVHTTNAGVLPYQKVPPKKITQHTRHAHATLTATPHHTTPHLSLPNRDSKTDEDEEGEVSLWFMLLSFQGSRLMFLGLGLLGVQGFRVQVGIPGFLGFDVVGFGGCVSGV